MSSPGYNPAVRSTDPPSSTGNPLFALVVLAILLALAVVLVGQLMTDPVLPASPALNAAAPEPVDADEPSLQGPRKDARVAAHSPPAAPVVIPHPAEEPTPDQADKLDRADELARLKAKQSKRAAGLIDQLWRLGSAGSTMTPGQIQEIYRALDRLAAQGRSAVPAIYEFLRSQDDLAFAPAEGGESMVYSTLRLALLDVLGEIGGPEAEAVLLDQLQTSAAPVEVAAMADILEYWAPGEYRETVLRSTVKTLKVVSQGTSPEGDPLPVESRPNAAPLFEVFQKYGDDDKAAAELASMTAWWGHYAPIALANLPDGQGIPSLTSMVQSYADLNRKQGQLALQLLAQVAAEQPAAREFLLERVQADDIPDTLWPMVAEVVAGNKQLEMEKPRNDDSSQPVLHYATHSITGRWPQTIYKVDYAPVLPTEEVDQRLALIDELAKQTENPAAITALSQAQSLLLGKGR